MPETVCEFETFEGLFLFFREVFVRGPGVGEVSVSGAVLGENVGEEERVGCSAGVE